MKCKNKGGGLAIVSSLEISNFLTSLTSSAAWIGGKSHGGRWTWNDGTPWQWSNWGEKQSHNGPNSRALAFNLPRLGKFANFDSTFEYPFICQFDAGKGRFEKHKKSNILEGVLKKVALY